MTDDERKEEWIKDFTFYSGQKWGDPPPIREEAERAWQERQAIQFGPRNNLSWSKG